MQKLPEGIRKILARFRYYLYIWKLIFSTAFKKIKYREKFKFLLITPEHCNLGDHAIAAAEEALFKDFFLFEITERSLDKFFKYFRHSLSLKLLFGKSDILIHGGGFIGTIWPYSDILTQQIIELLPHSRITLLPNTIFFSDDEEGRKWLEDARKVYNSHKNITLCTREKLSYDNALLLLDDHSRVKLIPDMVLSLDECREDQKRSGAVLCLRNDCEKIMDDADSAEIYTWTNKVFDSVKEADMCVDHNVLPKNRLAELEKQFETFRKAEIVITDRLHGMIFAAITGTPCAVFFSMSHKVKGIYDWCLSDVEYIQNVENCADIAAFYEKVKGRSFSYDNTALKPYYDELIEIIK